MFQIAQNILILMPMLSQLILFQKTFQPHSQNAKWKISNKTNKTNNNTHTENDNKKQQTVSIFFLAEAHVAQPKLGPPESKSVSAEAKWPFTK